MIRISKLVLFLGSLYHDERRRSGEQTMRPGQTGPVGYLLGGVTPTGCFFFDRVPGSGSVPEL